MFSETEVGVSRLLPLLYQAPPLITATSGQQEGSNKVLGLLLCTASATANGNTV